ncbi:D-alanyl-D-alanine carboxypeptidase family protein [Patescibacteria group bacterium]|nr:D-alanyl-D-alanine carboxypeptidase family protein [Patescibacteria group bacterium]
MSKNTALYILISILIGTISFGVFWHMRLSNTITMLAEDKEVLRTEIAELKTQTDQTIADLGSTIDTLTKDRDGLKESLEEAREENESVEKKVSTALKTVETLSKLAATDPELLQKYSKVYFLNEHYAPPQTKAIDKKYLYTETDVEYLHAEVMPFFKDMVEDALDDGIELYVVSAFRSFDQQKSLKSAYSVTYGTGANTFSADQGYSEHQLGTTVDFTTTGINGGLTGFDTTPAYTWLTKNAYRYGFVLSYPKNNQYYIFEPWHWRFVGTDLARDLHNDKKYFYDLDQREIEEYRATMFD